MSKAALPEDTSVRQEDPGEAEVRSLRLPLGSTTVRCRNTTAPGEIAIPPSRIIPLELWIAISTGGVFPPARRIIPPCSRTSPWAAVVIRNAGRMTLPVSGIILPHRVVISPPYRMISPRALVIRGCRGVMVVRTGIDGGGGGSLRQTESAEGTL